MLWKVRAQLIQWLAGDRPVALNCRVDGTLTMSEGGMVANVSSVPLGAARPS